LAEAGIVSRILKIEPGISLGQWAYDRISHNWDRIGTAFVGAGGMSYLASITDWLAPWGPAGIGGVGLISGLALWIGLAYAQSLRAMTEERRSRVKLHEALTVQPKTVNPLSDAFENTRISVQDFFSPFGLPNRYKRFSRCEIIGPGTVVLSGCSIVRNEDIPVFQECNIMIIRNRFRIMSVTVFAGCTFIDCSFFKCTVCFGEGGEGAPSPPEESLLNPTGESGRPLP
jgi:hypothetical protein